MKTLIFWTVVALSGAMFLRAMSPLGPRYDRWISLIFALILAICASAMVGPEAR